MTRLNANIKRGFIIKIYFTQPGGQGKTGFTDQRAIANGMILR